MLYAHIKNIRQTVKYCRTNSNTPIKIARVVKSRYSWSTLKISRYFCCFHYKHGQSLFLSLHKYGRDDGVGLRNKKRRDLFFFSKARMYICEYAKLCVYAHRFKFFHISITIILISMLLMAIKLIKKKES
jgi:hypothetical protein